MGGGTGGELHRRDLWKLFSNLNSRGSPAESQAEGGSSPGVLYSCWRTLLAAQDTPSPPRGCCPRRIRTAVSPALPPPYCESLQSRKLPAWLEKGPDQAPPALLAAWLPSSNAKTALPASPSLKFYPRP